MAAEEHKPDSPGLDSPAHELSPSQGALLHLLGELRAELDRILASLPASTPADVGASQKPIAQGLDHSRSDKRDDLRD